MQGVLYQHIDDCLLEGCRHVRPVDLLALHLAGIQVIQHCRLQSAEAEIIFVFRYLRSRERNRIGISLLRQTVNFRAARISESDRARHLVKCLARRVISGSSDDLILPVILHHDKMRVSAGCHKAHKRRLQLLMFDIICADMSADMMHTNQRKSGRKADCLRLRYTDQQCADQSGAVGDGDGCNIPQRQLRLRKRLFNHLINLFDVLSGCNFRHHSAVLRM